jgi:glycosyltransferase involved in cell wall biosynthesis
MLGWEFPPFVSGGLGIHCFELSRALAALGVEIDFFMPATAKPVSVPWMRVIQVDESSFSEFSATPLFPFVLGPYAKPCGSGGKPCGRRGTGAAYGMDFFEAVDKYNALAGQLVMLYHSKKPYDLVHCHDWITAKAGLSVKKALGLPLVFTVHSTEYDRTADLWPYEWILNVERAGVKAADRVIAVSNRSRQQLIERFGADPANVAVVYNAVDCGKFGCEGGEKVLGGREKVVLYHGRLSVQKGIEFFIRAAQKVLQREKNVRFVVSGKGDLLPRLVEQAISLGIADKITFAGYVEDKSVPKLYAASDVFVLPSVSEPFGITALEAMASGTPVIVSKSSGVGEIANHCLKVDFWDVDELANKILALLRYPVLGREMSQNESGEVRTFTWNATATKTLWAYGEAIAKRGAGAGGIAEPERYQRQLSEIHP